MLKSLPSLIQKIGGAPAPWLPTDLPSLKAWYDASDAATITHSSNAVSQWDDKSGNSYNVTQGISSEQPLYSASGNSISFDGVDDALIILSKLGLINDPNVIVCLFGSFGTINAGRDIQIGTNTGPVTNCISLSFDGVDAYSLFNGGNNIFKASKSTNDILILQRGAGSLMGDVKVYLNGTELNIFSSANPTNTIDVTDDIFSLGTGSNGNNNIYSDSTIRESIIVNSNLDSERQKTEGYLAWKWDGINGNNLLVTALPANHPYKNARP